MRARWPAWLALAAVAVMLLAGNTLADRFLADAQLDLTASRLYTLSPGTRNLLAGLRAPLTAKLYFSRGIGTEAPGLAAYADRVRDTLRRYAEASAGKLRLEVYDPAPFSALEDRAVADGLQGITLRPGAPPVYFGLVGTDMLDGRRAIAFFDPARERFLDYDLTRMLLALSDPKRPVVGVLSSLPLDGDSALALRGQPGGEPWVAMSQLRQAFDVRRIGVDTATIDREIQVLVVAHPRHLAQATLYAIDQYVMRGGRLLAMVDPDSEAQAAADPSAPNPSGQDTSSDLAPLLAAWGVRYDPGSVVADLRGAWRVRDADGQIEDYPAWFSIGADAIARDDPATGDLDQVTLASPGALSLVPGAAVTFTPLLRSSAAAALLPAAEVRAQPDPAVMLAAFRPAGGAFTLAARVRGILHSAFSGPPPGVSAPYLPVSRKPTNFVVVADSDVLADRFWVRTQDERGQPVLAPFSDNGAFLVNLVGTLAGGDTLLDFRAHAGARRPLTVIDAMLAASDARLRQAELTLRHHLDGVRKQLDDLRTGRMAGDAGPSRAIVTAEQQALIDQLTDQVADTQGRLRAVQRSLRENIDGLEFWVRLLDVAAMPAMLGIGAIALAVWRDRRRRPLAGLAG